MKIRWQLFGALVGLLFCDLNIASADIVLRVAGDDKFPPYSFTENKAKTGIDYEIVVWAARRAQVPVLVNFKPFKRVLGEVRKGKSDLGFALFKTSDREKFARFLRTPLHHSTFKIFVKKGREFEYKGVESLFGKKLAINLGFSINNEFDAAVGEGKIITIAGEGALVNIRRTLLGHADAAVGNYHVLAYTTKKEALRGGIVDLPAKLTDGKAAYLVASKASLEKNPEKVKLVDKLEKALAEMAADGTIDMITRSYIK